MFTVVYLSRSLAAFRACISSYRPTYSNGTDCIEYSASFHVNS